MAPILIATEGPLKGSRFSIADAEIAIGRAPANTIAIQDLSVSRRHCAIARRGAEIRIADLGSHNGTFVNGLPIRERVLEDGDRVDIGETSFLFSTNREDSGANSVLIEEGTLPGESTVLTAFPSTFSCEREMAALQKVSTIVDLTQELYRTREASAKPALGRSLFELVFDLVPADRGALLVAGENDGLEPLCGFDRRAASPGPVTLNRGVVDEVTLRRAPLTGNPAVESARMQSDDAPVAFVAAPLLDSGRLLGILYLDSRDVFRRFVDPDVQLASAIAGVIALAIQNASRMETLELENRRLRTETNIEHSMVGESARIQQIYHVISRVSPGSSTVLIRGESGTGKELVARAIHRNSPRAEKPFVAINCAALTETLLESELFGHEKGAFTGAFAQKKGKLEMADGGTVFLDEIGELALPLQAKLLRVLQEHEFERVGGTRTIKADIRVLAATNRDLEAANQGGSFRRDLYYRLNVVAIEVPPLRERRDDIPLLAAWFAQKFSAVAGRQVTGISPQARTALLHYDWPGNVRELENAIERAVVLGSSHVILPEDLPEAVLEAEPPAQSPDGPPGSYHEALKETKKRLILDALDRAGGNFTEAAKLLGVHPNYLHRLASNLQLRKR